MVAVVAARNVAMVAVAARSMGWGAAMTVAAQRLPGMHLTPLCDCVARYLRMLPLLKVLLIAAFTAANAHHFLSQRHYGGFSDVELVAARVSGCTAIIAQATMSLIVSAFSWELETQLRVGRWAMVLTWIGACLGAACSWPRPLSTTGTDGSIARPMFSPEPLMRMGIYGRQLGLLQIAVTCASSVVVYSMFSMAVHRNKQDRMELSLLRDEGVHHAAGATGEASDTCTPGDDTKDGCMQNGGWLSTITPGSCGQTTSRSGTSWTLPLPPGIQWMTRAALILLPVLAAVHLTTKVAGGTSSLLLAVWCIALTIGLWDGFQNSIYAGICIVGLMLGSVSTTFTQKNVLVNFGDGMRVAVMHFRGALMYQALLHIAILAPGLDLRVQLSIGRWSLLITWLAVLLGATHDWTGRADILESFQLEPLIREGTMYFDPKQVGAYQVGVYCILAAVSYLVFFCAAHRSTQASRELSLYCCGSFLKSLSLLLSLLSLLLLLLICNFWGGGCCC